MFILEYIFLGVVVAIIALVNLDSYFYRAGSKISPFGWNSNPRRNLFKNYVKHVWSWCKRFINKRWAYMEKNPALAITYILFVLLVFAFVALFYWHLYPLIKSLVKLIEYQIANISIGSRAFRNASLSIAGSITLLITLLGVLLTLIRNLLIRQQNRIDEERIVTEQISRAVEQMGAYKQSVHEKSYEPNIEVRLGGLYSLQRIMKDSPKDEETIAKIFYAYVRENAKKIKIKIKTGIMDTPPREDVQAALDIMGQFNKEWKKQGKEIPLDSRINLSRSSLAKYSFANMDLSNAILEDADLSGVELEKISLSGINLSNADLSGAYLYGIDFTDADLSGANLSGASLYHVYFTSAYLPGLVLSNTGLYDSSFRDAILYDVDLSGVDLSYVMDLTQRQIDLADGDEKTKLPEGLEHPEHWKSKKKTAKKPIKKKKPAKKKPKKSKKKT